MSKYISLLILLAFLLLFFVGCGEREDFTKRAVFINPIKDKKFIVLGWESIDKTDFARVIVRHKDNNKWKLSLIESRRFVPEIGEEVSVCFVEYFSDSRGEWQKIPIIKH